MAYLWSDAWLLQAIAIASHEAPASLSRVLGAADGVNHAMPTDDELHGAFVRLTAGGHIEEVEEGFRLTERARAGVEQAIVAAGRSRGREAAAKYLGAEEWTPERNVRDPRNNVRYPALTDDRIRQAEREYRDRIKRRPS